MGPRGGLKRRIFCPSACWCWALPRWTLGGCQLACPLHVPVTMQATFLHVTIPEAHQTFLFTSVYGARMNSLTLCLNSSDTGPSERQRGTSLLLAGVEVQTPFPHPCGLHWHCHGSPPILTWILFLFKLIFQCCVSFCWQRSDSIIYIYAFSFYIYHRILNVVSLCYAVGPCYLSVLCIKAWCPAGVGEPSFPLHLLGHHPDAERLGSLVLGPPGL